VPVVCAHLLAPAIDVFRPRELLAEHDLVVAGIGVEKDFQALRVQVVREERRPADVEEDVRGPRNLVEALARHAKTLVVQKQEMPPIRELRRVPIDEIAQELGAEPRIVHRIAHARVQWPTPRVLVVIHVMPQPRQPDHVMKIIPRHATQRVVAHHAGDDDAELFWWGHALLVRVRHVAPEGHVTGARKIVGQRIGDDFAVEQTREKQRH
jgi:hypothetical protein